MLQSHVTKPDDADDVTAPAVGGSGPRVKLSLSEHERKMIDDLSVITRTTNPKYGVVSQTACYAGVPRDV